MKRIAIIAAVAASLAAPAFASPVDVAIQHFNQDFDRSSDVRTAPAGDELVTVSTRNGSALGVALDVFNADKDNANDLRGLNGATVLNNTQVGADIFAAIRAESRDDE